MLLSVKFPTNHELGTYLESAGTYAKSSTTPVILGYLSASATADQWQNVILDAIIDDFNDDQHTSSLKNENSKNMSVRPVKPNDDNYSRFIGKKWRPPVDGKNWLRSAIRVGGNSSSNNDDDYNDHDAVYPHYDCCAECTRQLTVSTKKPESSDDRDGGQNTAKSHNCGRCKFVKYCGRPCQVRHWKRIHRHSCEQARPIDLHEALLGHEGYWISPDECNAIQMTLLSSTAKNADADLVQCFTAYFASAATLGGCFVL
jgi:hypothetical protein